MCHVGPVALLGTPWPPLLPQFEMPGYKPLSVIYTLVWRSVRSSSYTSLEGLERTIKKESTKPLREVVGGEGSGPPKGRTRFAPFQILSRITSLFKTIITLSYVNTIHVLASFNTKNLKMSKPSSPQGDDLLSKKFHKVKQRWSLLQHSLRNESCVCFYCNELCSFQRQNKTNKSIWGRSHAPHLPNSVYCVWMPCFHFRKQSQQWDGDWGMSLTKGHDDI